MQPDHVVQLAALTTGSQLKSWIEVIAGNLLVAFLAVRGIGYFIKSDWGAMVTMAVAAVFVGALVWSPDSVKTLLTGVWSLVQS